MGESEAAAPCLGAMLVTQQLCCMSRSLLSYSSKGQILLCYFYEVKRRGAQAEEKQSKTFITDIVMIQRVTVPLHLNATQAMKR